jgi:hypothetical protein
VRQVFRGDAFAFVANRDSSLAIGCGGESNPYSSRWWGVPNRVVQQDHQELMETVSISRNLDAPGRFQFERVAGRQDFSGAHRVGRDLIQADPIATDQSHVRVAIAGIRTGKKEQVVEQSAHAVAFSTNVVEGRSQVNGVQPARTTTRLPRQDVYVAPDRGQRRAQLV